MAAMREQMIQMLWRHASHRSPLSGPIFKFARRYMLGWYNANVDIRTNGEAWLIGHVASRYGERNDVYFDVGANRGEWSAKVLQAAPDARLFAFEPVAATCRELEGALDGTTAVVSQLALSDRDGTSRISYAAASSDVASLETVGAGDGEILEVRTRTGAGFCEERGIDRILLLKVDTEGHDLKVLKGFAPLLEQGRIDVVQFEYNYMSIYSRTFLRDYFGLLEGRYEIGRLLPNRIEFFPYRFTEENFIQSNFVAVRRDLMRGRPS
ncbi:MAG: FkbM family methyltransferase [Alphaproteobacteria bacterium]|nr:FkbM family methyltransferase [Alphaproteobacteria bacterium]